MTVLLIDDNADQLTIRSLLLEQQGFQVLSAHSREDAMKLVIKSSPQCAVVDLCLPDLDSGLAALRDLRAQDGGMRLIALTGYGPETWQYAAARELAGEVVVKGAGVSSLMDALRKSAGQTLSLT